MRSTTCAAARLAIWFGLQLGEIGSQHTLERGREESLKERSGQVKEEREN